MGLEKMAGIDERLKTYSGGEKAIEENAGLRNVYEILCSYSPDETVYKFLLSKDIGQISIDKRTVRNVIIRRLMGGELPLEDVIYKLAKTEKSKFQKGQFESDPAKIVAASAYVSMLRSDEAKSLLRSAKQPASLDLILLTDELLTNYEGAKQAFSSVKKKNYSDAEEFCLDFFRECARAKAEERADAALKKIRDAEKELAMQSPSNEEKCFLMIGGAYSLLQGKNAEAEFSGLSEKIVSAKALLDSTAARMLEAIIAGKEKIVATAKDVLYSESASLDERITSAGNSRELLSEADKGYKRIEEMPGCSKEISARVRSRRSEINSLFQEIDKRIDFCRKTKNECARISEFLSSTSRYEKAVLSMRKKLTNEELSIFKEMAGKADAIIRDYAAAEKNEREYLEGAGYERAASFYKKECSDAVEIARHRAEHITAEIEKKRAQLKSANFFNCALRGGLYDFKKRSAELIKEKASELEEALKVIRLVETQKSAET